MEGRYCYKGSGPKGEGYVAFSGDLNEMGAQKISLESIRVVNQETKGRGV